MKKELTLQKTILSGLLLALGIILPFLTGQLQQFGSMMLPMHLPVLICGFVCGPFWGLAVGFITPLLRSLMFHMPPMFPIAITMAFELAAYGLLTGLFGKVFPKGKKGIFTALLFSMLVGRVVWGLAAGTFYGMAGMPFNLKIFVAGAFLKAWPGIIIQLIIVPPVVAAIRKLTV